MDVAVEMDGELHIVRIGEELRPAHDAMQRRKLKLVFSHPRTNILRIAVHDPHIVLQVGEIGGDVIITDIQRTEDCRQAVVEALEDVVRRGGLYAEAPTEAECEAVGEGLPA